MKRICLTWLLFIPVLAFTQATPDKVYEELFADVQLARVFPDGKTFVDMVPNKKPSDILKAYRQIRKNPPPGFSLQQFVQENFTLPPSRQTAFQSGKGDVVSHIETLWSVLQREPDRPVDGSSQLPLPYPYIVPGGRFREIYYWDSYFTMLGLRESGQWKTIEDMVNNFAHMVRTYGHIPNGSRSYYLSRSQPPFFALMVDLLSEHRGEEVWTTYLDVLEKEYAYWMQGAEKLAPGQSAARVVRMPDGSVMNRYWDDLDIPRQESYREDVETAKQVEEAKSKGQQFKNQAAYAKAVEGWNSVVWRDLRAGAASGWDFSSRWFADRKTIASIRTTSMVPVDLNSLLYQVELILKKAYSRAKPARADQAAGYTAKAGDYDLRAKARKKAIETYCWNEAIGTYADFDLGKQAVDTQVHMGSAYPLFVQAADRMRGGRAARTLVTRLLKGGGFVTTEIRSGQQWDAPNGWAPLQWMAIIGLEQYEFFDEAKLAAERWVKLNKDVFQRTGKLMEKYNVVDLSLEAGGGEYPSQDGFGWTNGVLLALIRKYNLQ